MRFPIIALCGALSLCLLGCSSGTEAVDGATAPVEEANREEADAKLPETDSAGEPETKAAPAQKEQAAQTKPSSNSSQGATPSANNASSGKPETSHVHSWTAEVVHHDAVYGQQWVDDWVWLERYQCKTCGTYTYSVSEANGHQKASGRGGCGAYVSAEYQENRGYYEQVCIQEAYDETVGYSCSCGAAK